jgi:pimeloyl-ACP methyl ester carboxylesterase
MTSVVSKYGVLVLVALSQLLASCAHLDRTTPGWNEFTQSAHAPPTIQLHHEERGSGDPILFLHGFAVNSYTWRHLASPLSAQARVILLDLKGFGESPKPDDDKYSLYDQARLVYRFIVDHHLTDLTIIGHSYGGGVALVTSVYLSQNDPKRLRRLILIDSIGYGQKLPQFIKILTTPVLGRIAISLVPVKQQVRSIYKVAFYNKKAIPADAVEAYSESLRMPGAKRAVLRSARQIMPSDMETLTRMYDEIRVPTLIIWGAQDKIVPLSVGEQLEAQIPHATLAVINHCGHIPQEERPEETLALVNDFLHGRALPAGVEKPAD